MINNMVEAILNGANIRRVLESEDADTQKDYWLDVSLGNPVKILKDIYDKLKSGNVDSLIKPLVDELQSEVEDELEDFTSDLKVTSSYKILDGGKDVCFGAPGDNEGEDFTKGIVDITFGFSGKVTNEDFLEDAADFYDENLDDLSDAEKIALVFQYLGEDYTFPAGQHGGDYIYDVVPLMNSKDKIVVKYGWIYELL